jgi:hypothetical protein
LHCAGGLGIDIAAKPLMARWQTGLPVRDSSNTSRVLAASARSQRLRFGPSGSKMEGCLPPAYLDQM